eukprot:m.29283 g.29283  ORF g.29283 m.29283 type:complete len:639 (+) comp5075_c0_seq1:322-2238(+)
MPAQSKIEANFLRAVARGDAEPAERYLRRCGPILLSSHGSDGCTPLLIACKKGYLDVARLCLAHGASIADKDRDPKRQGNALHYAAWGGHEKIVLWLLEQGASLDAVDVVGNTPLLYAVYGGHKHIVQMLLRRGRSLRERNNKNHTVILQAACGGHLELVAWLLDQGFDLSETDNDGNTSLLFAAWGGHLALMQYLLGRGASLNEKNHNGHSVFLSAANGGRVEVVEWLLSQGFALNETNNNGDTALLLAAYCGHRDLVAWLLDHGSTLDERNNTGMGVLISAANGGHLEVVDLLVRRLRGRNLEETDEGGYTPFLLAAQRGHLPVVQFLAAHGANIYARTTRHNNDARALAVDSPDVQEYLTYIQGMDQMQIACDARLVDCVHQQLLAGVNPHRWTEGANALMAICSRTGAYPGAPAPCPETTKLVEAALKPWAPHTHALFSAPCQAAVMQIFTLRRMLEKDAKLPFLPHELWLHIGSFVTRDWFPSRFEIAQAKALRASPRRAAVAAAAAGKSELAGPAWINPSQETRRSEWRRRTLLRLAPEPKINLHEMLDDEDESPAMNILDADTDNVANERNAASAGRITPQLAEAAVAAAAAAAAADSASSAGDTDSWQALKELEQSQILKNALRYRVTWV